MEISVSKNKTVFRIQIDGSLNLAKESMDYRLRTSELTVSEVASDFDIAGFHRAG